MLTFTKFLDFDLDKDREIRNNEGHVDNYRHIHLAVTCGHETLKKKLYDSSYFIKEEM